MSSFSDYLTTETMRRLDHLALGSRWTAEGGRAGRHTSVLKGASVEFRDHRNYVQGDNLRHLDWKLFGRSERYFIKQYQEETSLRVHLVLDASASMAFRHSGLASKYEFARELAAAAAYLAHHQQDSFGLVIYDDQVRRWLPTKGGSRHVRNFLEALGSHQPSGRTDTGKALEALAEGMARRGLVLMMSDLLDDPEAVFRALAHFRRRGHDVVLIHVLDPAELTLPFNGVSDFIDMETGERLEADAALVRRAYRDAIDAAIAGFRARCGALRVDYRIATTERTPAAFLSELLAERKRLGA
ncbi:MAG: DUF58 domain-containing protein [Verrucomicrobiota bacterium]